MGVVGQLALKPSINRKEVPAPLKPEKERDRTSEKGNGLLDLNLKGVHNFLSLEEYLVAEHQQQEAQDLRMMLVRYEVI